MKPLSATTAQIIARYYPKQISVDYSESTEEYLPVLRPLTALRDRLPEGGLPLIDIAKLAMGIGHSLDYDWYLGNILVEHDKEGISLKINAKSGRKWEMLVDNSWNIKCWLQGAGELAPCNQYAIHEYLRQNLFAVGVSSTAFIPLMARHQLWQLVTKTEITVTVVE